MILLQLFRRQHLAFMLVCLGWFIAQSAFAHAHTVGLNFTGGSLSNSGFIPPDSMGTVGPEHIVEMINGSYSVYNKKTGGRESTSSLNTFWENAGAPYAGSFAFDPRVQYDPATSRFYAASVDNFRKPNNILFAVSNTSNPLQGWTGFSIDSDSDDRQWADFPQMGFSADSIVISNNMFGISGSFEINMLVIPKLDVVSGLPTIANATLLENQYAATGFEFALQAAIDLDNSDRPLRLFSTFSRESGTNSVGAVQIDDIQNVPQVNNIDDIFGLTFYNNPPLADQPGPKTNLDSGGNRTRSAITLINGSYYGVQGVKDPESGNAALRWYKIDADTMMIEDEGLIADPELDLIYGSISANEFGDIVIGFTGSSETQFASAYAIVGDTNHNGDVLFGELILLQQGVADYQPSSSSRNRWGDYSSTVLDPEDPFRFWTFQEYVSAENKWSIKISEIIVSPVPEPSSFALFVISSVGLFLRRVSSRCNIKAGRKKLRKKSFQYRFRLTEVFRLNLTSM